MPKRNDSTRATTNNTTDRGARSRLWRSRILCAAGSALLFPSVAPAAGPPDKPPPPLVAGAEHQVIFRGDYAMDFRLYRLKDRTLYVKFRTAPTSNHMDPRR